MKAPEQQISHSRFEKNTVSPTLAAVIVLIQSACALVQETVIADSTPDGIASEQVSSSEITKTIKQHMIDAGRAISAGQTFLNRGAYNAAVYWFNAGLVEARDARLLTESQRLLTESQRLPEELRRLEAKGYHGIGETLFTVANLVRQGRCPEYTCAGFMHDPGRLALLAEAFIRKGIECHGGGQASSEIDILVALCRQYADVWARDFPKSPAVQSCLRQPK